MGPRKNDFRRFGASKYSERLEPSIHRFEKQFGLASGSKCRLSHLRKPLGEYAAPIRMCLVDGARTEQAYSLNVTSCTKRQPEGSLAFNHLLHFRTVAIKRCPKGGA